MNRKIDKTYGPAEGQPGVLEGRVPEDVLRPDRRPADGASRHRRRHLCPIAWSKDIVDTLESKDKDVTFHSYSGAGHTFEGETWQRSIKRTADFFDKHLD